MNFLAHILLSCDNEDLLLGNFMADFIKNSEVKNYSPEIQRGIELHRKIDHFTDTHKEVRKGSARLRPIHRKYAPVVIDILYDNVLAKNWSRYHGDSLTDFTQDVYAIFSRRISEFPPKLQRRVPLMIEDNFLMKYGLDDGLRFALTMMDRRTKFPSNFVVAADQLEDEWDLFNEEFNNFFPEVIQIAELYCAC